jgi:hypothetical protein
VFGQGDKLVIAGYSSEFHGDVHSVEDEGSIGESQNCTGHNYSH